MGHAFVTIRFLIHASDHQGAYEGAYYHLRGSSPTELLEGSVDVTFDGDCHSDSHLTPECEVAIAAEDEHEAL